MKIIRHILLVLGWLAASSASAQVPQLINYQGRISVGGTNFDGTGQFNFALVNTAGTVNYWANDGTATGQPATGVSLTVTKGLYAVLLGDTTVSGMTTAIVPTVFTNSDVRLRVWFNDGVNGFQQLTPDQRIAAVGYALVAASVPDASITTTKLANGAVNANALAASSVTLGKLDATGANSGQALTFNGTSLAWTTPADAALSNQVFTGANTFSGANNLSNAANTFTGTFSGNGANLTSLNAANLTGSVADARLSANVPLLTSSPIFAGTVTAPTFSGSGAGLTSLPAASLTGSITDARLSANVGLLNGANAFTGTNTFSGRINSSGANAFTGVNTFTNAANTFAGAFTGNGTGLTGITATASIGTASVGTTALVDGSVTTAKLAAGSVGSSQLASGAVTASTIASGAVGSSQLASSAVSAAQLNLAGLATTLWQASGNAGTTAGTHYLGTSDNQALEFKVNGARALRLEPNTNGAPNVLLGSAVNYILSGVMGATIGGGGATNYSGSSYTNGVNARFGTIAGGGNNVIYTAGPFGAIGGGFQNGVSSNAAVVAGGYYNLAGGFESVVGGGEGNTASGAVSFVGGGITNVASGIVSFVGGGSLNGATNYGSVVVGGYGNLASATNSMIGGGVSNVASGIIAVVSGGFYNAATNYGAHIGGGVSNYASGYESVIGGGELNTASGAISHVGGGYDNGATNYGAVVSGGYANLAAATNSLVAGGAYNVASGTVSVVGGGYYNGATGQGATVPGGWANLAAGSNSFAAGFVASAANPGAFVWSDSSSTATFSSTAANQFNIRSAGGVRIATTSAGTVGAQLLAGATSWSILSDRNLKKDFAAVDGREVLRKLDEVSVQSWRYNWDKAGSTPHLGPVAQEFKAAFYPGRDDKSISTLEFDGVELAAIQGLHQLVKEKDVKISALEQRLADIEAKLEKLGK